MKITTKQLRRLIVETIAQDGVGIGANPNVRKCLETYDLLTFEERQYVLNVVQSDVSNGPDHAVARATLRKSGY